MDTYRRKCVAYGNLFHVPETGEKKFPTYKCRDRRQSLSYRQLWQWSQLNLKTGSQWYFLLLPVSKAVWYKSRKKEWWWQGRTIFSKTNFTDLVALCARLIHSAMRSREFSIVVAPTVEPGLSVIIRKTVFWKKKKNRRVLKIVQLQTQFLASLQVI